MKTAYCFFINLIVLNRNCGSKAPICDQTTLIFSSEGAWLPQLNK